MTFRAVSRSPVYIQVADQLRDAIYSGELAAGEPLPTERELAEMMGASRASIREALRLLQSEGIISGDALHRRLVRGTQDGQQLKGALTHLLRLQTVGLDDLVEFRRLIEAAALRKAALRPSDPRVQEAAEILAEMRTAEMTAAESDAADIRFHVALVAASGNEVLRLVMFGVREAAKEHFMAALSAHADRQGTIARLAREHGAILEAVRAGDPDLAATLIDHHISDFYRDAVQPQTRTSHADR